MINRRPTFGSLNQVTCRVDDIDGNIASVIDQFGRYLTVRLDVRRGVVLPRPGETWILDRTLGPWTFAAQVRPATRPQVSGTTDDIPALKSLIEALIEIGLPIEDLTVDIQMNARHGHTHPHTHVVPGHQTQSAGDPSHRHNVNALDTQQTATPDVNPSEGP